MTYLIDFQTRQGRAMIEAICAGPLGVAFTAGAELGKEGQMQALGDTAFRLYAAGHIVNPPVVNPGFWTPEKGPTVHEIGFVFAPHDTFARMAIVEEIRRYCRDYDQECFATYNRDDFLRECCVTFVYPDDVRLMRTWNLGE